MKNQKEESKYIKNVFAVYPIWKILQIEIILILTIGYLDWLDVPSQAIISSRFAMVGTGLVGILLFAIYKNMNLGDYKKIVAINIYDLVLVTTNLFAIGYCILGNLVMIMAFYKWVILLVIYILSCVLIVKRRNKYLNLSDKANTYQGNIIDLKILYEGELEKTDGILLLEEKDVDYDLLNRQPVINHLYNTLCNCKPQGQFVISLEGKWGVGKTTILQNVKKLIKENQEDIVIIDNFEPWMYGNEQSLVNNFFNSLLKSDNVKVNSSEIRKSISVLSRAIINSSVKSNLFEKMFLSEKTVQESKEQINEYLRLCGKKIVFVIDNLDRVEDEKVLFLFRLIGTVLNFDRVIYVVLFDPNKVEKIFNEKLNIDYRYLEKIIQMQISVPENDSATIGRVVQRCTQNLLRAYNLSDEQLEDYTEFIECLCENIKDIRDYKRIVNSIIVKSLQNHSSLSKRDLLIMEYIKMSCFPLYQIVYRNGKFFISEAKMYNQELYVSTMRKEDYERDAKKFFKQLFEKEEYCKYQTILARIFPNVKKYCESTTLYGVKTIESSEVERTRGIANAKYFSLYFSETENEFSILGDYIQKFVEKQNYNCTNTEMDFERMLQDLPASLHKELLETIQLYLSKFEQKALSVLVRALIKYYWDIDDSSCFFALNARKRSTVIVSEILQMIDEEDFILLVEDLSNDYDKLELVNSVKYWFENDSKGINQPSRHEKWNELENEMVEDILKNHINLYANQYYHHGNAWGMCRHLKEHEGVFREYIKSIGSHKNIFRILYDVMGHSFGSQHTYYFQSDTIKYFLDEQDIKLWMDKAVATTEDEIFIKQLYDKYLLEPQDPYGDSNGISCSEERKFDKL